MALIPLRPSDTAATVACSPTSVPIHGADAGASIIEDTVAPTKPIDMNSMPRDILPSEATTPTIMTMRPHTTDHTPPLAKIKAEARAPAMSGSAGNTVLSLRMSDCIEHHYQR